MKIVVIGGSGLIGTKLVKLLRNEGHEVVPASPSTGVNTFTGEGLADALAGAAVVVAVVNSPSFEDRAVLEFFETAGRNIHAAEAAAGVGHHVALSVVGTDRLQASGYFRAKLAQENLIKASGIPYTIVRATQFFEFVGSIADSASLPFEGKGLREGAPYDTVRVSPALMQPIAGATSPRSSPRSPPANRSIQRSTSPAQNRFAWTISCDNTWPPLLAPRPSLLASQ